MYKNWHIAHQIRIFILLQVIWLIDSVTHKFGNRPYATRDGSTNFHLLDWITLGEGYHNNHHAFPSSPCFGFDRNQFDVGWIFIKGMEKLGQVYDLKAIPDARRRQFRKSGIGRVKGLFSRRESGCWLLHHFLRNSVHEGRKEATKHTSVIYTCMCMYILRIS